MKEIRSHLGLKNPLCLALDLADRDRGLAMLALLGPHVGMVKCGSVPFLSWGREFLVAAEKLGIPVFLDLKWHDIPNTVFEVLSSLPSPAIRMVTLHAQGGPGMITSARRALNAMGEKAPALIAVTLLTHLTIDEVQTLGYKSREEGVSRLGQMALSSGADGLVMAPGELRHARELWGPAPFLVTPGIRPSGPMGSKDDQANAKTPREAREEGSDLLVVGRPLLEARDPLGATIGLLAEIGGSVCSQG